MLKRLLKALLQRLLILIALVVASAIPPARIVLAGTQPSWRSNVLPDCSVDLRVLVDPRLQPHREANSGVGAKPSRKNGGARRGGYLRSVAKGTAWMFAFFALLLLCLRVRLHFSDVAVSGSHAVSFRPQPTLPWRSPFGEQPVTKIIPFRKAPQAHAGDRGRASSHPQFVRPRPNW